MQFQFDISSGNKTPTPPSQGAQALGEVAELLRQMLDIQREQLNHTRTLVAAQDVGARWRALLARWTEDFPEMPGTCRRALPVLEKAYGSLILDLVEELADNGDGALDNDFSLQEFLDRYGMRLGQIGNLLNLVAPLAEASNQQGEASQG